MSAATAHPILQLVRRMADDERFKDLSDAEVLQRFRDKQDQAAFHALLRRHGPMVLDVCRSIVGNEADAEDAFQATFLVLAHKSQSIRKSVSLASWLHGVAYRIARKAQVNRAKRRLHEARGVRGRPEACPTAEADDFSWREACTVLHEEVNALSERHRSPLVLCYLQGNTQDEAAALLGMSESNLKKRLERGRALLRARLVRRGLGASAGLLAAALPASALAINLPEPLLSKTASAASSVVAGKSTAAVIPASVAFLLKGALRAMFFSQMKSAAALVLLGLGLCAGVMGLLTRASSLLSAQAAQNKSSTLGDDVKAQALSVKEYVARAERSLAEIEDLDTQVTLLIRLAKIQARRGERAAATQAVAKAKLLCEKIKPDRRGNMLGWIAEAQTEMGDTTGAFDTAEFIARIPVPEAEDLKYRTYWFIARAQAQRGEFQAALMNADQTKGSGREWLQDGSWRDIAIAQSKAGKDDDALRTAARVQAAVTRAATWANLAKELHSRKHTAAKECLRHAGQALQDLAGHEYEKVAESHVLDARAALGEIEEALRIAKDSQNEPALMGIAVVQAQAGSVDKALETARLVKESTRDFAICQIANFASFEQAKRLVEESASDWAKASVWITSGQRSADKRDHKKAGQAFKQAAALCAQMTDPPGVVNARLGTVLELAEAMARAGLLEDAVAFAEAQREPVHRAAALLAMLAGKGKE
ncbi:MAG: sigma-70 family RNA polymerase sigma factor [Gemmataceae bacterium]|nr:sigma-70 family RNA polymerase sigma factor [Gemmataceae bacterium]